ncbi:hypothetical protein BDZ94DRAFT_196467 [Collybia nuda]|uniref:Uncharacterized protein n=1 Tax=Collybia nuda TaxID=64659 RepID=A0A9P5XXU2_9AGAR|nr:hypothetical protein BDZ94DRAFT_196467 [Collybia nuda]
MRLWGACIASGFHARTSPNGPPSPPVSSHTNRRTRELKSQHDAILQKERNIQGPSWTPPARTFEAPALGSYDPTLTGLGAYPSLAYSSCF